jgi:hypothetical protein
MREYGVPEKMIKMVKILNDRFESIADKTGVKQDCLLSGLLFLLSGLVND